MPFVDYLKRIFGINDSHRQSQPPLTPPSSYPLDEVDRQTLDLQPYQEPFSNFDADQFFDQHIQQLENFLRILPGFTFPFGFDSPGSSPYPDHQGPNDSPGQSHPQPGIFSFPGISGIFSFGNLNQGIFDPTVQEEQESLSPRDEILKPSFRSSASPRTEVLMPSSRSSIKTFIDEDYDDVVKEKGPDVILDILKKSEESDSQENVERRVLPARDMTPKTFGRFTSTKFSFVNGQTTQEQITRLPDGTYEKRVTTTDSNGQTNTVVSHYSADEIILPSTGGFGGPRGFGGFGPSFW